jgi:hypothetical protein
MYLRVAELEDFSHELGVLTHCLSFSDFDLSVFIFNLSQYEKISSNSVLSFIHLDPHRIRE